MNISTHTYSLQTVHTRLLDYGVERVRVIRTPRLMLMTFMRYAIIFCTTYLRVHLIITNKRREFYLAFSPLSLSPAGLCPLPLSGLSHFQRNLDEFFFSSLSCSHRFRRGFLLVNESRAIEHHSDIAQRKAFIL